MLLMFLKIYSPLKKLSKFAESASAVKIQMISEDQYSLKKLLI